MIKKYSTNPHNTKSADQECSPCSLGGASLLALTRYVGYYRVSAIPHVLTFIFSTSSSELYRCSNQDVSFLLTLSGQVCGFKPRRHWLDPDSGHVVII
jgi:hypothetical protein